MINLNSDNFETEVLQSDLPFLVDFWAVWCGPCIMVTPVLEELAKQFAGRIRVGKIDIDESKVIASQYKAHTIPMFIIFKDGLPTDRMVGALSKTDFERFIKRNIL